MTVKKLDLFLRRILLVFLGLACSYAAMAQARVVSGTVKDPDGVALPGVSIVVKNTTTGTNADVEGKFSIQVPNNNAVLVFTFVGYVPQEVTVGSRATFDIVLVSDVKQLGEVIVTALGVERNSKSLQSAVTKVPGVSLTQARENNFGASIEGRVAGVNVSKASTGPAGSSRVIIRGNKSLGGNNQPLYVIDGVPMGN